MNLFKNFVDKFGNLDSAIIFLSMNGHQITVSRYKEWLSGKRLPRRDVLSLILSSVTDTDLDPVDTGEELPRDKVKTPGVPLNKTITVPELRKRLPHRRFCSDWYMTTRTFDAQVLNAIHGFNVYERFESMCGNFNSAVYVLRRNCTGRRVTEEWVCNRIDSGWYPDVVNVMVDLIDQFHGTTTPFTGMILRGTKRVLPVAVLNAIPQVSAEPQPVVDDRKRRWVIDNMLSLFGEVVAEDITPEQVEEYYTRLITPAPVIDYSEQMKVIKEKLGE